MAPAVVWLTVSRLHVRADAAADVFPAEIELRLCSIWLCTLLRTSLPGIEINMHMHCQRTEQRHRSPEGDPEERSAEQAHMDMEKIGGEKREQRCSQ